MVSSRFAGRRRLPFDVVQGFFAVGSKFGVFEFPRLDQSY